VLRQGRRPGHWGLPGMRERAESIGAVMELWSEHGAGTEIELGIPGKTAYGPDFEPPGGQPWWKKKKPVL
jgi:hypothetical protein